MAKLKNLIELSFEIFVSFCFAVCMFSVIIRFNHSLPYRPSEYEISLNYCDLTSTKTNVQIKNELEKIFNVGTYRYIETENLNSDRFAETNVITKTIRILPNLNTYNYAHSLAHEFVHVFDKTSCERYCEFKVFKTFYESDDEFYINVAKWLATVNMQGLAPYEYDCSGYISKYFIELKGK